MWSQRYDLHSHSLHSDGEHPVERVAELMHGEGVQFWALTDHDTTAGWQEAHAAATERGLIFVPGVEITCEPALPPDAEHLTSIGRERASASWHLLAYFPDHVPGENDEDVASFKAWLAPHQDGRLPRMMAMSERLGELGMPVSIEEVSTKAHSQRPKQEKASSDDDESFIGLTMQSLNRENRKRFGLGDDIIGAVIVDVERDSAAFEAGLRPGDVVSEIDQRAVGSAKGAVDALQAAKQSGRNSVLAFIRSTESVRFIAIPLND